MPNQTAASSGNKPTTTNPVRKIIAWVDRKLAARADNWLDRIGPGRRNLLKVSDVFTINDDRDELIADVKTMGAMTLGYPKLRALNDKLLWFVFAVAIIGAIGVFAAMQLGVNTMVAIAPAVVLAIVAVIVILPLSLLNKRCDDYTMALLHRFAAIEFGINYGHTQPGLDRQQIETLFQPFLERGNHSNKIDQVASAELAANGKSYPYTFFSYEYVDRVERAGEDDDATDDYRYYTRWGIVLQNAPIQGVALSSDGNDFFEEKWDTASLDFNKLCRVTTADQMAAARFLQPAVVEKLTAWFSEEPDFDLAFLANQPTLMWQSHRDVFATDTDFAAANTASELAARLNTETLPGYRDTLDKMRNLLTLIGD